MSSMHIQNEDPEHLRTRIFDYSRQIALLEREREVCRDQLQRIEESTSTDHFSSTPETLEENIDYVEQNFSWSNDLEEKLRTTFAPISSFRFCQRGICNAALDKRDIICIMPTGSGKSLTFQLPAVLETGVSLIFEPLLSLINDQVESLRRRNVQALQFTGDTQTVSTTDICQLACHTAYPLKIIYTTPEKFLRNAQFRKAVKELYKKKLLARFVIDEAHYATDTEDDHFRPEYRQLGKLRTEFPDVPITALTATCPPDVLEELLKTLKLGPVTDGSDAVRHGTAFFTMPLYRQNLHYSVILKRTNEKKTWIPNYIQQNYPNESGIIYCSTRKGCEIMAENMVEQGITADFFHAGSKNRSDGMALPQKWKNGEVQVICATTAFGLGIDKPNVRFVIHETIAKSVEAYVQESGRAGRDGHSAQCILLYDPQDVTNVGKIFKKTHKLKQMINYAHDVSTCRRIQFSRYFSLSSVLSFVPGDMTNHHQACGHCDSCERMPDQIISRNFRPEVKKILELAMHLELCEEKYTVRKLTNLIRDKNAMAKIFADDTSTDLQVGTVCGGKEVHLSLEEVEMLILELFLRGSFKLDNHNRTAPTGSGPQQVVTAYLKVASTEQDEEPFVFAMVHKPTYLRQHIPKSLNVTILDGISYAPRKTLSTVFHCMPPDSSDIEIPEEAEDDGVPVEARHILKSLTEVGKTPVRWGARPPRGKRTPIASPKKRQRAEVVLTRRRYKVIKP